MAEQKEHVLILCTGNSARSQMAEGLLRARGSSRFEVYSAGSDPADAVHPVAIRVMDEIGLSIADYTPKPMQDFIEHRFDYVLTVCDHAAEVCPVFPGTGKRYHRSFPDPAAEPPETQVGVFRRVRNDIAVWLDELFMLGALPG
jgi:arsenate reductase